MTIHHQHYDQAAQQTLTRIGKKIILGIPLGIGKPVGLVNAFYRLAEADNTIDLTIITGLTLARPFLHNDLEKRFIDPIMDRLLGDYEAPLYERARELQQLPSNIQVIEFYLSPGKFLHNNYVQQNYISSNYTHVSRDLLCRSINVIAQQIAPAKNNPNAYSLSSNPDLFIDVASHLQTSLKAGGKIAIIGEINTKLPYMYGAAEVTDADFTDIVNTGKNPDLFALPRDELSYKDHLIGIHASSLIRDDGCLQIGIGKLGNALAAALVLRHKDNTIYREICQALQLDAKFGDTISCSGSLNPFEKGLYASTEMLSDEYMQLYQNDILKKCVYDHVGLQRLLNENKLSENITPDTLKTLIEHNIINEQLTEEDLKFIEKFGIRDKKLKGGKLIHAAFFLGSQDFYQFLRNLSASELEKIDMTSVSRTNSLLWSNELLSLQRQHARFANSVMMVTLGGAIVSDGLVNNKEVSGVGGQFDFINMAFQLDDARSIVFCHSTRTTKKGVFSNIVWDYPNNTIPRYLRDIVITEYGIADCRCKTDAEIIQALLNITDSRFQQKLLKTAKKNGKLPGHYVIPKKFTQNYPEKFANIIKQFQAQGYCQPYPFGSDFTEVEQVLARALLFLKTQPTWKLMIYAMRSLFILKSNAQIEQALIRMQLSNPKTIKEFFYKKLLIFSMRTDC